MKLARVAVFKNHRLSKADHKIVDLGESPLESVIFLDASLLINKCALGRSDSSDDGTTRVVLSTESIIHQYL